jgi:hypothetical protein
MFIDYFWDGKMPDKLVSIFYSFTSNSNLYSTQISPEIYQILENRYMNYFNEIQSKYFLLLKYTKGLKISFISESLTRKLNYKQKNLINNDLNSLLVKELIEPHSIAIKQYFIL